MNNVTEEYNRVLKLRGEVCMLPGPWDPVTAVNMYRNSSFTTKIWAFEDDEILYGFIRNKLKNVLRSNHKVPVEFIHGNIFDYANKMALRQDCPVRGLDFDICDVFRADSEAQLFATLELFMNNKDIPTFWFRFTGATRNNTLKRKDYINKIIRLFKNNNDGVILDWRKLGYKDDSPMLTYQGVFTRIPNVLMAEADVVLTSAIVPRDHMRFVG